MASNTTGNIGDYEILEFQLGDNIFATIQATSKDFGEFTFHKLIEVNGVKIRGNGEMYADAKDFVCLTDELVTWSDFLAQTTGYDLAPRVSQGRITFSPDITTIASKFLCGFWYEALELPYSLTSIGDFAFSADSIESGIDSRTNKLKRLEIPENVVHIGKGAFSYNANLTSIVFYNPNYILEDYTENVRYGIFWLPVNWGDWLDASGNQKTGVEAVDNIKNFDWVNKYNRYIVDSVRAYIYVHSNRSKEPVKIGLYNQGDVGVYINDIVGYLYAKVVPVTDTFASPVRIYTKKGIRALRY
jgi:hypothetical protein